MTEQSVFKREVRSFVLRGGRMTASQQRAFDTFWPEFGLDVESGPLDFTDVFGRSAPTVLEIGFGMGDSLVQMALNQPSENFIGIEVHKPGVGRLLHLAESANLTNVRLFCADALEVLAKSIPEQSLERVQLYFPDPWHKKKHHKRRIVQPAFAELVLRKLRRGGCLHIATDWENYAEYILALMDNTRGFRNLAGRGHYSKKPEYRPSTKFERRGEKLGHSVWDLLFEKI